MYSTTFPLMILRRRIEQYSDGEVGRLHSCTPGTNLTSFTGLLKIFNAVVEQFRQDGRQFMVKDLENYYTDSILASSHHRIKAFMSGNLPIRYKDITKLVLHEVREVR